MKEVHPSRFQYAIYMLRIQAVSCKMTSKKSNFYSSMHKVIFFSSICEINKYICKVRVSFAMISSGKRVSTRVERKKSIGETFYVSINDMLIVMCAFRLWRLMRSPRPGSLNDVGRQISKVFQRTIQSWNR